LHLTSNTEDRARGDIDATQAAAAEAIRRPIGVWTEWPRGAGWTNEGMTRLLGFIIEGAALHRQYIVHVFVARHISAEVRADLGCLRATAGLDYVIQTSADDVAENFEIEHLIDAANSMAICGWIVLYPYMRNATRLVSPVAVILPDANPIQFPNFGDDAWDAQGAHTVWRRQVAQMVGSANRVVTFSKHVADNDANKYFSIPRQRIDVIPHAPPNLLHLLPFVDPAQKTSESVALAAHIVRRHCVRRGWRFLEQFPFEETRFFLVSTQDRTTKNLVRAVQGLDLAIRGLGLDLRMFTTAPIHAGIGWTQFPAAIEAAGLQHDVVSMHNLPRETHAALYHCATFAVHTSLFEGGQGPFPFYEAVSVGTPCLIADGPHARELLDGEPALRPFLFDPYDAVELARLMLKVARDPADALAIQREVVNRLGDVSWQDVAAAYARSALAPAGAFAKHDRQLGQDEELRSWR